jgi:UDP-N-acetylglucosamine:LPS N-acetylglucosamine transferase
LALRHPDAVATAVVNPILDEPASQLLKGTEQNYDRTVTNTPNWFRFTYTVSDSRPASVLVENTLILALHDKMKRLFREFHPDAILNTSNLFNAPAGAALNSMKQKPPLYTVVTDLADVHCLWFNSAPDRFFVASESVQMKAVANGIPEGKIFITGIPVDPDFGVHRAAPSEMRLRLGLDPRLATLLFVGSRRVRGIVDHLEALEDVTHPFQVAVVAGGDDEQFEKIGARGWKFPIRVEKYVTNMPEWMACADILVTKAGGLILSEGMAAGLPIILIDYLPGQEEGNVRFILDHQAGVVVDNSCEFSMLVDAWLKEDQNLLKVIASNSRRQGNPEAAYVIADALWQATEHHAPRSASPSQGLRGRE